MFKNQLTSEDGQSLMEYALMLALVLIIVIVALNFLGPQKPGANLRVNSKAGQTTTFSTKKGVTVLTITTATSATVSIYSSSSMRTHPKAK
jgi:preprotein translocase subunit SecG